MKVITQEQIDEILDNHSREVIRRPLDRLDFSGYDLSGMDLSNRNLKYSRFIGTKMVGTDLSFSNISFSNLTGAKLDSAKLCCAIIRHSSLENASLKSSNITNTVFAFTHLTNANLKDSCAKGADFRFSRLRDTILDGMEVDHITTGIHPAPEGDLIGWGKKNGHIVKFLIPAEAKRSCATTRKHRAEFAKVLEIEGADEVVVEDEQATTVYRVGKIVRYHKWDADRWNECGGGIHFFLTRKEAEAW